MVLAVFAFSLAYFGRGPGLLSWFDPGGSGSVVVVSILAGPPVVSCFSCFALVLFCQGCRVRGCLAVVGFLSLVIPGYSCSNSKGLQAVTVNSCSG